MMLAWLSSPAIALGAPQAPVAAPQDSPATTTEVQPGSLPPLTEPRPQSDTFTEADERPGSRDVKISFAENFIADRLPFDVPFNVTGSVDPAVRRLQLSVYRVPSSVDLARLIDYLQNTVDCVGQAPPGRQVSQSAATPSTAGAFSLFVNALDPQNYYALCFVGVTPVPGTEFDADVRRAVAALVPRLDTGDDVSRPLLAEVRATMRERIAQLGAGRPVRATIPAGNMFDTSRPSPDFTRLAGALAVPIINLPTQAMRYETTLEKLMKDLDVARATAPIPPDLVDALPSSEDVLPTMASAITGSRAFDESAFAFSSGRSLLAAALKAPELSDAGRTALNLVSADLVQVIAAAASYGRRYNDLRDAANRLMGFVALEVRNVTVAMGSSVLSADLARSAYVSLDAGIAYPWRLENMVFYAGTNIYFRPINKAAPLRYKGTFLHRFALTVGITTTVQDKSRRAEDLRATPDNQDASNSLLLGAGIRVTPSLRAGGGVLVFKESDPNPLIDQSSVAVTPYVSFTADVNVAQIFRSLF